MTRTRTLALAIAAGTLVAAPAAAQSQDRSQDRNQTQSRSQQDRSQQDRFQTQDQYQQDRQRQMRERMRDPSMHTGQQQQQGYTLDWQATRIVGIDVDNDGRIDALYEINAYELDRLRDGNRQQQMSQRLRQQQQFSQQDRSQQDWRTTDDWQQRNRQLSQQDWRQQDRQQDWRTTDDWQQRDRQLSQQDWRQQDRQQDWRTTDDWQQRDRQLSQQDWRQQDRQQDWRTGQQDWQMRDRQLSQQDRFQSDWRQDQFRTSQGGQLQQAREMLSRPITASGTVEDTRTFRFEDGDEDHLLARVSTNDNRELIVDLGPASKLRDKNVRSGEDIAFRAYRGSINDRTVYFADEVQVGNRQFRVDDSGSVENERRISGSILDTREINLQGAEGSVLLARLRTDDGQTTIVSLGKKGEIDESKVRQGKNVEIHGVTGRLDGNPIHIARRLRVDNETIELKQPGHDDRSQQQQRIR